jgi:hypothetical protein
MSNLRGATLVHDTSRYAYLRAEGYFCPKGSVLGQSLLSMDDFTLQVTTELLTKDDNQGPVAEQAYIKPLKTTTEGSATLGNFSDFALRAMFNSDESDGNYTQAAVANGAFSVLQVNQKVNGVYRILHPVTGLPMQNLSNIAATWGTDAAAAAVVPVEGVDYTIDRRTGTVQQLLAAPALQHTAGDLVINYHAAAIAAADNNMQFGIGSAAGGKRGSLHLLATNEDYFQFAIDLWDVLITTDGPVQVQNSSNEASTSKIKINCQPAQFFNGVAVPYKYRFGRVIQLSSAPLVA